MESEPVKRDACGESAAMGEQEHAAKVEESVPTYPASPAVDEAIQMV